MGLYKMKVQVRNLVFETNSSSVHSVVIKKTKKEIIYYPIKARFGEFGWGYERLRTPEEKLSYILTEFRYKCYINRDGLGSVLDCWDSLTTYEEYKLLNEIIRQRTGSDIIWNYYSLINDRYSSKYGYIDHQSLYTIADSELDTPEKLVDFIFNPNCYIIIDNDNH